MFVDASPMEGRLPWGSSVDEESLTKAVEGPAPLSGSSQLFSLLFAPAQVGVDLRAIL